MTTTLKAKALRFGNLERLRREIVADLRFGTAFQCSESDGWDEDCRRSAAYSATGDESALCHNCLLNTRVYGCVQWLKKRVQYAKDALVQASIRELHPEDL